MKNIQKRIIPLLLVLALLFGLAGCSSHNELTEENVTATVATVETALKEFDQKTLKKYVESKTLDTIFQFAKGHEQFNELGKTIFSNLTMEVESIDLNAKTVTVKVTNKNMKWVAADFTKKLLSTYSTIQLLTKLSNDAFLDEALGELQDSINKVISTEETTIILDIQQGKKNLVLSFNDIAEDAVSGGALNAISSITNK